MHMIISFINHLLDKGAMFIISFQIRSKFANKTN